MKVNKRNNDGIRIAHHHFFIEHEPMSKRIDSLLCALRKKRADQRGNGVVSACAGG